jgi:hypothetical protein
VEAENPYVFVGNNPLTGVDPHGMDRQPRVSDSVFDEVPYRLVKDPASCMETLGSDSCAQAYVTYQDWYVKQNFAAERQNRMIFQLMQSSSQPGFAIGAFIPFVFGGNLEAQMAAGSLMAAGFSFGNTGMVPRKNQESYRIIRENIQLPHLLYMGERLAAEQAVRARNMIDIARADSRSRSAKGQRLDQTQGESPNKMPRDEPASAAVILDVTTGRVYWGISGYYGGAGMIMPLRVDPGLQDRYHLALSLAAHPRNPWHCGEMMAQNQALLDGAKAPNLVMMSFGIPSYRANPRLRLNDPLHVFPQCPNCRITTHPEITVLETFPPPAGASP